MELLLYIAVSMLICCVIGYVLGVSEDNGVMGGLLGIFFGPIGLILVLMLNSSKRHDRERNKEMELNLHMLSRQGPASYSFARRTGVNSASLSGPAEEP